MSFGREVIARTLQRSAVLGLLLSVVLPVGCQPQSPEFREVKRVHEKVTETELRQFLRVVKALPDGQIPAIRIFRPLPSWDDNRTLPVSELVKEERKNLEDGWDVDWQAERLRNDRTLQQALRREKITLRQFVGLAIAVGGAIRRTQVRENQSLDAYMSKGRAELIELLNDDRPFTRLTREQRFAVLRKAGWLTRMNRAERLSDVPPENIALVTRHEKELRAAFPGTYFTNPFDDVADLLEVRGTPFEELPESGSDTDITWDRENAIIGHDEPDTFPARSPSSPPLVRTPTE